MNELEGAGRRDDGDTWTCRNFSNGDFNFRIGMHPQGHDLNIQRFAQGLKRSEILLVVGIEPLFVSLTIRSKLAAPMPPALPAGTVSAASRAVAPARPAFAPPHRCERSQSWRAARGFGNG